MLTAHGSTKFLILVFIFLKDVFFLCSSLMRFFVVQIFSFSRAVCSWLRSLDEFIVAPIIYFIGLAIVAKADLCCGDFLSEKSCHHKLLVSTSFWSWLLNVSSVLTSLKYIALLLWFVNALWVCWWFLGVLSFWFWSLCFWKMSFLCSFLIRSFVVQIFSFFRTTHG